MATVIGIGVIILLVLWLISLLSILLFCTSQRNLKGVAAVPCIITDIVTIVLLAIPTSYTTPTSNTPSYNYSYIPLIWIFILTSVVLSLIICLLIYLLSDVLEPRYAPFSKVIRKAN